MKNRACIRTWTWVVVAGPLLLPAGCEDEATGTTTTDSGFVASDATRTDPECEELAQACHLYDQGADSGVAHTCHQFHAATSKVEDCRAMRATCLAACGGSADGATESAVDSASD